ncbi:MAG: hypothetical protein AB1696_25150 [Planctomycetota bacterium]
MSGKATAEVLKKLENRISSLRQLVLALENPPAGQHRDLISRIAVEGRSITNILQNLRSSEAGFNEWYKPYEAEMRADALLRFFYQLRSETLKKGDDHIERRTMTVKIGGPIGSSFSIDDKGVRYRVRLPDGTEKMEFRPKPQNAVQTFVGDDKGGSGWIVRNPDGTESKVYFEVPTPIFKCEFYFRNPPLLHLGESIQEKPASEMCRLYVGYLGKLVAEAKTKFVHKS